MISNDATARAINDLLIDIEHKLADSMDLVKRTSPTPQHDAYRAAIGRVVAEILTNVIEPLYAAHPELQPPGWTD
jgi:hypothetical protein